MTPQRRPRARNGAGRTPAERSGEGRTRAKRAAKGRTPVTLRPGRAAGDAWARVREYPARGEHWVVGLMTGTSADAVDAALVRFEGAGAETRHELVAYREFPLDEALRAQILLVAAADSLALERLMELDAGLGRRYAECVLELLDHASVPAARVDAIGSHGQTVRHLPRRADHPETLTLQIGSAAILAERTGIPVVSDFRARDAAAGGQGAPLVPLVDWWLFRSERETRVLVNLGGMANVTYIPRGGTPESVIAFDTGPGNAVMDALARMQSNGVERFDRDGAAAARGKPSEALLAELLADPFFSEPPPRSTGRERFGERYAAKVAELARGMEVAADDLMATATMLTAASVAQAVAQFLAPRGPIDAVFASGGGAYNATLMRSLEQRLKPARVRSLATLGVAPEAKEALAFAFLAHQTLSGLPGNLPSATGARHPVVLGHITPGGAA